MALNEYKFVRAKLPRKDIAEILIGLGETMNRDLKSNIVHMPENATLEDFFRTFNEGNRDLSDPFYVQTRLENGRAGISYSFESLEATEGKIWVAVLDNGENAPQAFVDAVHSKIRNYLCGKGLEILEEGTKSEY